MVAVYPITPQTSLVEQSPKLIADGRMDADIVDAEASIRCCRCCRAARSPADAHLPATCGPGLGFMFEPYFRTSGMRLPMVMTIVTRDGITHTSRCGVATRTR